jgi:osmotically-inducible protein OsmY
MSDESISRCGLNWIRREVPIVIGGLKVIVHLGHVTLRGHVDLEFLRVRAEKVVRAVPGVVGVTNEIAVTPRRVTGTNLAAIYAR